MLRKDHQPVFAQDLMEEIVHSFGIFLQQINLFESYFLAAFEAWLPSDILRLLEFES
ncbi:hypothetical protein D9M71_745060 [compost metagenome]